MGCMACFVQGLDYYSGRHHLPRVDVDSGSRDELLGCLHLRRVGFSGLEVGRQRSFHDTWDTVV